MQGVANPEIAVHRRTGGLERAAYQGGASQGVHRRTGGLESYKNSAKNLRAVHRRTGGLEITLWKSAVV